MLTQWISVDTIGPADGHNRVDVLDPNILAQLRALEEPGDVSLLTELCEAFRESTPGHIRHLNTTLAAGDAAAFADAAHALKGSAGTLGATRLRIAAAELERRGRDQALEQVDVQLIGLEAAYAEALEALVQEVLRSTREFAA